MATLARGGPKGWLYNDFEFPPPRPTPVPRIPTPSRLTLSLIEILPPSRTHGHSRPFLPSMVRKNDPDTTQTQTSLAASHLLASPPPISFADVRIALDHVTKLTGIGPATGTLILSIFDPEHIPFFQDEMYEWFFPGSGKLKYTLKEYEGLYDVVAAFGKRFVCKAVEVEKVAFVLGHWGMLGEEERKELEGEKVEGGEKEVEGKTEDEIQARNGRVGKKDLAKTKADVKVDPPKAEVAAKKGRKRAAKDLENTDGAPTAKRRSLRNR